METIFNGLITVASAVIGLFLGAWLERRRDREKAEVAKAKAVYETCLRIRELLAEWYNGIEDAVRSENSPSQTLVKLEIFHSHINFERRLQDEIRRLQDEPLCSELIARARVFERIAFRTKGVAKDSLQTELDERFPRDYEQRKDEALRFLKSKYATFEVELKNVITQLEAKMRKSL